MSGDETFALIISAVLGVWGWSSWIGPFLSVNREWHKAVVLSVMGAPMIAMIALGFVLLRWSAHDVRDDGVYLFFYSVMGFGWTGVWLRLFPYVGLSCRDDALERNNSAAAVACGGALVGITLAFAGGNIGDGPGWWVVVFSAGLATGTLMVLWVIGNAVTRVEESITIDRDAATACRATGFFIGGGLIVGNAVAGDWESAFATTRDFVSRGFPVIALWVIWMVVDRLFRPGPTRLSGSIAVQGLLPALVYVLVGYGSAVLLRGWR